MNKIINFLLATVLVVNISVPAFAADTGFTFEALADGKATATATVGDVVEITLKISGGEEDTIDIYALQDYLIFDEDYLSLDEDSIVVYDGDFQASGITFDAGEDSDRVYVNRNTNELETVANGFIAVTFDVVALKSGTTYITHDTVEMLDATGNMFDTEEIDAKITISSSSSGGSTSGGSSSSSSSSSSTTTTTTTTEDIGHVNGVLKEYATAVTTGSETEITVDSSDITTEINSASDESIFSVIVDDVSTMTVSLTLEDIENMAEKEIVFELDGGEIVYKIRTYAIDTEAVLDAVNATDSGAVEVTISFDEKSTSSVSITDGELIGTPVEFVVTASYSSKTSDVTEFLKYIERTIELTSSQAEEISTAVIDDDSEQRHVPTKIYQENGTWYADVNALNNGYIAFITKDVSFSDATGMWYEDTVNEMSERRIINGIGDNLFAGGNQITRAEFAALVVRALGLPADGTSNFTDVDSSAWYAGAVGKAVEYGIVNGISDTEFSPTANIKREEAMAMIQRASVITELEAVSGNASDYSDYNTVSDWAVEYVDFNVANGLIVGTAGALNPQAGITRAETATVILRLLQNSDLV